MKHDLEADLAALAASHTELQPQGLKLQKTSVNSSLCPSQNCPWEPGSSLVRAHLGMSGPIQSWLPPTTAALCSAEGQHRELLAGLLLPCPPTSEAQNTAGHTATWVTPPQPAPKSLQAWGLCPVSPTEVPHSSTSCCCSQNYHKIRSSGATPGHSQMLPVVPASVPSWGRIVHLTAIAFPN